MIVKICPVCGMSVKQDDWSETHTGIQYFFCSSQCLDNFRAHPLLYVGRNAASKHTRLVQRRFKLANQLDSSQLEIIQEALCGLMGIEQVEVKGDQVNLTYDLVQCSASQVEDCLNNVGVKLGSGWSARLKLDWIKYTEENELDNLAEPSASCCNRPPKGG